MRCNAINLLRQASECIEYQREDDGAYAFMLGELAVHLGEVRDGKHTWGEFAEAYCLTERDRPKATSAPDAEPDDRPEWELRTGFREEDFA